MKFIKDDLSCLRVGSHISQKGFAYPAEIMIYGDSLVLRCTESNRILKLPLTPRNHGLEPYIDESTFNELVLEFRGVSDSHTPFTFSNDHLDDKR